MARVSEQDNQGQVGQSNLDQSNLEMQESPANIQTMGAHEAIPHANGYDVLELPSNDFTTSSTMTRDGQDLVLDAPDGSSIVIEGYYTAETAPTLQAPDGTALTPQLVDSFAGNTQQYASNAGLNDESPVGTIQEMDGHVTVTRTDGTTEDVQIGTPIYQGDIVETDADGAANIVFMDETSFAVSENARLAIDEYVYDPSTESGTSNFSVLRGVFVFTSGLIGRDDPDDVEIETPVGSIGIRGTIIAGNIIPGGESEITVVEGAIVVRNGVNEKTLSMQFESVKILGFNEDIQDIGVMKASDFGNKFSSVSNVAPTLFSAVQDAENDQGKPGDAVDGPEGETEGLDQGAEARPDNVQQDIANQNPQNLDGQPLDFKIEELGHFGDKPLLGPELGPEGPRPLGLGPDGPHNGPQSGGLNVPLFVDINDAPTLSSVTIFNFNNVHSHSKGIAIAEINVADADFGNTPFGQHSLKSITFAGNTLSSQQLQGFELIRKPGPTPPGQHKYILKLKDDLTLDAIGIPAVPAPLEINLTDNNGNGLTTGSIQVGGLVTSTNSLHVDQLSGGNANGFVIRGAQTGADDNFGISMDARDIDGDGKVDFLIGASGTNSAYVIPGQVTDFVNHEFRAKNDMRLHGPTGTGNFGSSVAILGDVTSDGKNDILIGAPGTGTTGTTELFAGTSAPATEIGFTPSGITLAPGGASNAEIGETVTSLGDINNDGLQDFSVSRDSGGKTVTDVYYGDGAGGTLNFILSAHDGGQARNLGNSIESIGDVNDDGVDDFIVSLNGFDVGGGGSINGANEGGAAVIFGEASAIHSAAPNFLVSNSPAGHLNFSSASGVSNDIQVGRAGDFNGDGIADVMFSDHEAGNGDVYIKFGGNALTGLGDLDAVTASNIVLQGDGGMTLGTSISSAGDFNGDGLDDIAISDEANGKVHIVYGSTTLTGSTNIVTLLSDNTKTLTINLNETGGTGSVGPITLESAGDVNGDGFDDLMIGTHDQGLGESGSVFVINGGDYSGKESGGSMRFDDDNNNVILASGHNQSIMGTRDDDLLSDSVVFNGSVFRSGAGNDTININNSNFLDINGGSGHDTIQYTGTVPLDFAGLAGERVSGIEEIRFQGTTQTIQIHIDDLFDMMKSSDTGELKISANSAVGKTLHIDTAGGFAGSTTGLRNAIGLEISGGPLPAGPGTDGSFTTYSVGDYTLLVESSLFSTGTVNIS